MTRDEIVKAGLVAPWLTSDERIAAIERFAALVRADEREACARVVMGMRGKCWAYDHDVIAEAIRARGKA